MLSIESPEPLKPNPKRRTIDVLATEESLQAPTLPVRPSVRYLRPYGEGTRLYRAEHGILLCGKERAIVEDHNDHNTWYHIGLSFNSLWSAAHQYSSIIRRVR
jgi:hypothetical protein